MCKNMGFNGLVSAKLCRKHHIWWIYGFRFRICQQKIHGPSPLQEKRRALWPRRFCSLAGRPLKRKRSKAREQRLRMGFDPLATAMSSHSLQCSLCFFLRRMMIYIHIYIWTLEAQLWAGLQQLGMIHIANSDRKVIILHIIVVDNIQQSSRITSNPYSWLIWFQLRSYCAQLP